GGLIGLVEEGDIIAIDIPGKTLTLKVIDDVLAQRRENWQPLPVKITTGYMARYARLVTSANTGAVFK
ncbi:MAG: dihydroxy-acid dehydratase, partial [Pseudomonadota bacterium]|nr:dihydroxy-acid dehydratase [Pseudomonadota bacterium]